MNHYDGLSGVHARQKYEAYCAWERLNDVDPTPYDAKWWDGWRRYVAANPDWNDDAWKAEEARRRLAWRTENGYEIVPPIDTRPDPIDIASETMRLANMVESAATRRHDASIAKNGSSRTYLLQAAATSEREILASLPALLNAIQVEGTVAA